VNTTMAQLQGFFKIENKVHGAIGPANYTGIPEEKIPIVRAKNLLTTGIFSIVLAPDSKTFLISLIATLKGFLPGQHDTVNYGGKLYARVPGGVEPQRWFILRNVTDDTYVILSAEDHAHWELSDNLPGTQVLVKGGDELKTILKDVVAGKKQLSEYASKINEDVFWKLTRISELVPKPLPSGRYRIENVRNGPIQADVKLLPDIPVVSGPNAAVWDISRLIGTRDLLYTIHKVEYTSVGPESGRPANEINEKLWLPQYSARPDEWLVIPLQVPNTYIILRATFPAHWSLESNRPGTQVSVKQEVGPLLPKSDTPSAGGAAPFARGVASFAGRAAFLAELGATEDEDIPDDSFWLITAA